MAEQDNEQPLLIAEQLGKSYGRQLGCRDVSFKLYEGEVLAIVGESGSGKTTLLQLLSAQLKASAGHVRYRMRDGVTRDLASLGEGESIAGYLHGECTWHLPSRADMVCTHSPIGESPENWVAEKPKYHGEIMTADNYLVFGHYTQMVWKNTKEVGCGFAGSSLVCRYSPPGNYFGQKPY